MKNSSVVNKYSIAGNNNLKRVQKEARKYYQEKIFQKNAKTDNAPKAKIRKLVDLRGVKCVNSSDMKMDDASSLNITKDELIAMCNKASLTGRSGNGFPVSKKLESFKCPDGVLIINGVECDPGLATDSWLYRNRGQQIENGAVILKKALGLKRVILATKEPLIKLRGFEQIKVLDRFPLGYEKILIKNILGIDIGENEIPQDKGILVMNLQTVIAIDELTKNIDLAQYKYITVANLVTASAKVVRVKIGDRVEQVATACYKKENLEIYAGGGALNCHKISDNEIITDTTGYIALGKMPHYNAASKCKGCGRCTKNCPARVKVHKVVKNKNDIKECEKYNAAACIGCGACTYGCNAGIDVRKVVSCVKEAF